ncbi:MAG TPA: ribonuclease HII, partial [Megamonas hypermegale]|nr:ribonuclease HII [Megamonas hypermegale]
MDIENLSIKDIKNLIITTKDEDKKELWQAIKNDARKGVQALLKAHEREEKERLRVAALYKYEDECRTRGHKFVAGVDEVGRGPLAGPVVVSAVILPANFFIAKLNDSKKLSESTREKLYDIILENAVAVNTAVIDEKTIDRINIYQAAMNGMYQAIYGL